MRDTATIFLALAAGAPAAWAGQADADAHVWAGPSARFILQLGVLVFVAKMGGRLFHRWKLSRVLGEVAAGLLVGPFLLGGLSLPVFPEGLMSDAATLLHAQDPMYGVITIALVVFFFLAGLNTDVRQLRRSTPGGIAAGLGGFAFCFAVTLAVLVAAAPALTGGTAWSWATPQALLVCTAVSVSSVGMLARMLSARQRLESPAGNVALSAALTDNVVGLFLFTVFSGALTAVARGEQPGLHLLASMAARTVLGVALVAFCGIPVARFVNGLALRERTYTSAFAVSAACLLIAGGVMGAMGLSVMSGAYVMGLVFSTTDLRHEIRERLDFVSLVLVPVCFSALGMQLDLRLLGEPALLAGAAGFVLAACTAKAVGAALPALIADLNGCGCLRVGAAVMPRSELTLALLAALAGMAALPPGVLFSAVLLVAVSSLWVPGLVRRLFETGGNGTRKPFAVPAPVKIVFQFPSNQAAMLMINRAVEIFEDDGFYAHRLNRYQVLYRISREAQVIHLGGHEGEVAFECSERERPLVNAVMLELSSGVEQSLRELQKPLNDVLLRKSLQSAAPSAGVATSMLKNRFAVETLKPRLLATTKQGAISELVSLLYENGLVMDRERAVQAVFEREQGLSTGLEHGLAIPHARTDAVTRLVCAVGLKREGLDFDAADGKPTRIVVLVLAPDHAATPQLQLIAQVCRQLDEKGRASLLACETPEDMFAVLAGGAPARTAAQTAAPLATALPWQSVSLDLEPADQAQALSLLLALCARSGAVSALEELHAHMQARAPLMPERIADDVALFTVESSGVFRVALALGVSAQGVACACGGRCRVCVLALYPPSAAEDMARVKAALARALDAQGLAALFAAKSSSEAREALLR